MITIQAGYALVIDDEPANRDFLERLLQTASFKVSGAATGADGLKTARTLPALALALVDQELPDASGLEIIAKLREENPDSLLVMATMHDDRTLIDQAFAAGVDVFLVKPHGFMELYRRLQEVDANTNLLRNVIIEIYGPRPYKGADKRTTAEAAANAVTTNAPTKSSAATASPSPVATPPAAPIVAPGILTAPAVPVVTPALPVADQKAENKPALTATPDTNAPDLTLLHKPAGLDQASAAVPKAPEE